MWSVRVMGALSPVRRISVFRLATGPVGLACGLFCLYAGCTAPPGGWLAPQQIDVWAVPEGATVFQDSTREPENEVFIAGESRVRLAGAINEVVAFQLVIRSRGRARIANVGVEDFLGSGATIPSDRMALFREIRIPVEDYPAWFLRLTPLLRQPRAYPDILVPLSAPRGGLPIELQSGQAEALWCEIRIPPGTPPGRYDSKLRVTGRAGGGRELSVQLEVWPFALPLTRHLAVTAGLDTAGLFRHHLDVNGKPYESGALSFDDPMYPKATAVLDSAVRLLHDHRCAPVLSDVMPRRDVDPVGLSRLDWTDYDRLVSAIVDGSAFVDRTTAGAWPVPANERHPPPEVFGGWRSPGYERALIDYLRQCATHFQERGWLDRHFLWIPVPGATMAARYDAFSWLGGVVRAAGGRLRPVCTLPAQSMAAWGCREPGFQDVSEFVGIWAPPADTLDAETLAGQRSAGRPTWLNPSRPPFSGSTALVAPGDHARSLAWQAYRFGCEGLFLESVNAWAADGRAVPGDKILIWPGRDYGLPGPVASIRLKRLLRGIQDYEYLWLLEQNRRPAIARRIAGDLLPFGGTASFGDHCLDGRPGAWASDASAWSLARRLVAAEILSAMEEPTRRLAGDEVAEIERFERQIDWTRFTDSVRRIRVNVDGVRVAFNASDAQSPVVLEANVTLLNATRDMVNAQLAAMDMPEGWLLGDAGPPIADFAPAATLRRLLRIETAELRPNVDGIVPIRVAVDRGKDAPDVGDGRVAFLTSQRLANSITIDGKLDDWPLGAGNVAGDFLLVGAADVPKQGRPRPDRPSQQTTVFVTHDSRFLYFAFFCQDDRLADRVIARDNFVHYDELWPTGDDLVEVVIDPTAKAGSPGDLLHIVVKSNGSVTCERGVPALARVADCADWPAKAIAAVDDRSHADRWTVEIRLPIESLGEYAEIFGVNFGRYLPRLGEYSSWSGARRYLYSPASLGNIRLRVH